MATEAKMKKCDFCTQSSPKGKCYVDVHLDPPDVRARYCAEAIKRMTEALKNKE